MVLYLPICCSTGSLSRTLFENLPTKLGAVPFQHVKKIALGVNSDRLGGRQMQDIFRPN